MHTIEIENGRCIGCGTCAKVCPFLCFELAEGVGSSVETPKRSKRKARQRQGAAEDCVACRSCQIRCAEFAIDIVEAQV